MRGTTIRQRLELAGTTQADLASLLGVTPRDVDRMLSSQDVQTGTLERICEATRLPVTFFYGDGPSRQGDDEPGMRAEEIGDPAGREPAGGSTATAPGDGEGALDGRVAKIWETCRMGDKVRGLLRSQHKRMAVLCRHVGMTDPGLRKAFERDSCNVNVLVRMAEFFNVPVTYFLPEDRHAREESERDREIQYLKGQLKAYEDTLATVLSGIKGAEDAGPLAAHAAGG